MTRRSNGHCRLFIAHILTCNVRLVAGGIVVLALATLEHLNTAIDWFNSQHWEYRLLQVQISRSVPVGELTRFTPLNPVTILTATRPVENAP